MVSRTRGAGKWFSLADSYLVSIDLERVRLRLAAQARDNRVDEYFTRGWLLGRGFVEQADGRWLCEGISVGELREGEVTGREAAH